MPQIQVWDREKAKNILRLRLTNSRDERSKQERRWEETERTIYKNRGQSTMPRGNYSFESDYGFGLEDVANSAADIVTSYAFKNLRFIHSQLAANPPTVLVRPASSDQDDRKKADAADRLVRHAIRTYKLQDKTDRASLQTLLYGTSFIKTLWDSEKGDIIDIDEAGNITLEGDISIDVPNVWNIYIDPDANQWDDVRFMFERMFLPYEEALFKWPQYEDVLLANRIRGDTYRKDYGDSTTAFATKKYDVVELFEYWETGLPTNGYVGRFCICDRNGEILGDMQPNPFRFRSMNSGDKELPAKARLPYHIFTDIDSPLEVWGKSFIEYISGPQDTLNRLDSVMLDCIQAHGVARLILPEGCEIADDSISNSPWDIIKMTGNAPPSFMQPMPLPEAIPALRNQLKAGIDDMAGVNEAMFGQSSREQSGFSMQYATNQGNMIRKRLFNKYIAFTESIYKAYLNLVRKHWVTSRTIMVIGKEKALEAVEITGADIDGGYDLMAEYGASLSLDPMTRREEIMAMQPLFEKAGIPTRTSLKMMKLSELEGLYDMMELAESRQREIFEEMISTGKYIPPEELQDHENMIAYALQYIMTTEYKYLDPLVKDMIRRHVKERAAMVAAEKAPPVGQQFPSGPAPAPGPLPSSEEMLGQPAGSLRPTTSLINQ